jgi:hypothetical protein
MHGRGVVSGGSAKINWQRTGTHRGAHGQLLLCEQPGGSAASGRRAARGGRLGRRRCEEDRSCIGRARATRGRPRRSSKTACRSRELWWRHHAHAWRRARRFSLAPRLPLQPELRLQPLHVLLARLLLWGRSRGRSRGGCGRFGSRWGGARLVCPFTRCLNRRRRCCCCCCCCANLLLAATCRTHGLRCGLHRRLRGGLHRCQPPRHSSRRARWLLRIRLLRAACCCWWRLCLAVRTVRPSLGGSS